VIGVSWAGPLIRFASADALAISAWRLVISVGIVGAILLVRRERSPFRLTGGEWGWAIGGGIFLAGHFWSWIAAVQLTTVARAAILVSLQPFVSAALAALSLGVGGGRRGWAGMAIALVGVGILGGGIAGGTGGQVTGDLLALVAALCGGGYFVLGRRLRPTLGLWSYVAVVYGVAALTLTGAALVSGVALSGHSGQDWWVFVALAAGPMMIGHTGVNYALRYLPAHTANLALLGEPIGATLLAWWLPGIREAPDWATVAGGGVILIGIAVTTIRLRPARPQGAGTGRTPDGASP